MIILPLTKESSKCLVVFVCKTCGMYLGEDHVEDIETLSSTIERGVLYYKCGNCPSNVFEWNQYYVYSQQIGRYVHPDAYYNAIDINKAIKLFDCSERCACPRKECQYVVVYKDNPYICGKCGLLYWPNEFDGSVRYNVIALKYLQTAQEKQLADNHKLYIYSESGFFIRKKAFSSKWKSVKVSGLRNGEDILLAGQVLGHSTSFEEL